MKKISIVVYYIKLVLFIISFYFIFTMLHNILDTKIYGIIFIIFYLIYAFKLIIELLSQKARFKNDYIYNFMQIGLIIYILIISIRCSINKIYVTNFTYPYFRINFIILSILILFILIYSIVDKNSIKKR